MTRPKLAHNVMVENPKYDKNCTDGFALTRAFDWFLSRQKPFGFEKVTTLYS